MLYPLSYMGVGGGEWPPPRNEEHHITFQRTTRRGFLLPEHDGAGMPRHRVTRRHGKTQTTRATSFPAASCPCTLWRSRLAASSLCPSCRVPPCRGGAVVRVRGSSVPQSCRSWLGQVDSNHQRGGPHYRIQSPAACQFADAPVAMGARRLSRCRRCRRAWRAHVVPTAGFEPATSGSVVRCAIQLRQVGGGPFQTFAFRPDPPHGGLGIAFRPYCRVWHARQESNLQSLSGDGFGGRLSRHSDARICVFRWLFVVVGCRHRATPRGRSPSGRAGWRPHDGPPAGTGMVPRPVVPNHRVPCAAGGGPAGFPVLFEPGATRSRPGSNRRPSARQADALTN